MVIKWLPDEVSGCKLLFLTEKYYQLKIMIPSLSEMHNWWQVFMILIISIFHPPVVRQVGLVTRVQCASAETWNEGRHITGEKRQGWVWIYCTPALGSFTWYLGLRKIICWGTVTLSNIKLLSFDITKHSASHFLVKQKISSCIWK